MMRLMKFRQIEPDDVELGAEHSAPSSRLHINHSHSPLLSASTRALNSQRWREGGKMALGASMQTVTLLVRRCRSPGEEFTCRVS